MVDMPVWNEFEEKIGRLRLLAAEWRTRAAETTDTYYISLMIRTAQALEAQADALERTKPPASRVAGAGR